MHNEDNSIELLRQLEQLLTEQAMAIMAKQLDEVVRLSIECAELSRQISPMSPTDAATEQLLHSCRNLHRRNTAALTRLNDYCCQFISLLRGAPIAYASHAEATYSGNHRLICKL